MIKIRSKLIIVLVVLSGILDMFSTYRLGDYSIQKGLSFKEIASAESNWIISNFWSITHNLLLGILLYSVFILASALILFWVLPKKFENTDHTFFLIIGLGMIITSIVASVSNFYLLSTGKMLGPVNPSIMASISFFIGTGVLIWTENRGKTWVKIIFT